jgi:putative Holliday junction resolvase
VAVLAVVGMPSREDGTEHSVGRLARRFAHRLRGRFGIAVELVDERLTSDDAARSLRRAGARGARLKAALDPVAAQRILETFFEMRDKG